MMTAMVASMVYAMAISMALVVLTMMSSSVAMIPMVFICCDDYALSSRSYPLWRQDDQNEVVSQLKNLHPAKRPGTRVGVAFSFSLTPYIYKI
ncbi:hypothetical protein IIA15_03690 [candidate division TA06 bacterium]|nr:hypothetical protein [candidate division TA06 bacterium]